MKKFSIPLPVERICALPGTEYQGMPGIMLDSVSEPLSADAGTVIFFEQEKYLDAVMHSQAGLIITNPEGATKLPGRNLLITAKPYFALMMLVTMWLEMDSGSTETGISDQATVHPDAYVSPTSTLEAGVCVGKGAHVGDHCHIGANSVIGKNVKIGDHTRFYPNVTVYEDCIVGSHVILHSGCVIGADGFGFMLIDGIQRKIPQIGNVVIGNYVEIGANSNVDRATLGSTIIGDGCKLDNLVQIGHNCVLGKHCILCAHVGLAGGTILGDHVYLAGQVGAAGHLKVGDRAMIGAQSGITTDVPEDARYLGSPAMDAGLQRRILASQRYLPELYRFMRDSKKD